MFDDKSFPLGSLQPQAQYNAGCCAVSKLEYQLPHCPFSKIGSYLFQTKKSTISGVYRMCISTKECLLIFFIEILKKALVTFFSRSKRQQSTSVILIQAEKSSEQKKELRSFPTTVVQCKLQLLEPHFLELVLLAC